MPCNSCGSDKLSEFIGEIAIHIPAPKNTAGPVVWVFREPVVCLDCGAAQFVVPEGELRMIPKDEPCIPKTPPMDSCHEAVL